MHNNNALAFPGGHSPAPYDASPPSSGLNIHDFLFIFYRHKWKIVLLALLGFAAAAGVYYFLPAPLESQAKLLVRYVVERSAVDGPILADGAREEASTTAPSESSLNSEVEILASYDLAKSVALNIGPARLIEKKKKDGLDEIDEAALLVRKNTEVDIVKGTTIISIIYKNKDGKLAVEVLDQIIKQYEEKHLEVHRSVGGYEFVTKEAAQLKVDLAKTEADLAALKEKNGVSTISESTASAAAELAKAEADLDTTLTDLATQKVRVAEIDKFYHGEDIAQQSSSSKPASTPQTPDSEIVNGYQSLVGKVEAMRKTVADLLARYSPGSRMVKSKTDSLDALERQKVVLEKKYPALITTVAASSGGSSAATLGASSNEIILERARLAGLETHVTELKNNIVNLQKRVRLLNEVGPKIAELERTKDVQETAFRSYGASLAKSHIDAGLDPARMPNINIIQNPSPAMRTTKDLRKVIIALAAGGIFSGLAMALLIEFVFDRTVKRSRDLELRLRLPLMLTIPDFGGRLRLTEHADGEDVVETSGQFLRPFCEAIADRLGLFFELNNLAHKPKLVAVTGLSENAGVSTLASGLADALTEGDGKVLLVDKPITPKRFYSLMSEFKESEVDYVIFDMPSLGDTSSTLPMAGFMDKVLLVVEAEKSGRESVKRAFAQLSTKTDVSVIFNKARNSGPKWLEGEL